MHMSHFQAEAIRYTVTTVGQNGKNGVFHSGTRKF